MKKIFKPKQTSIDTLLSNDLCKRLLEEFCKEDLDKTTSLVLVYEVLEGEKRETYWKCAGLEPAQAILILDQLHHRIQHEGLSNYD